jgi:hypothetical protein
MAFILIGGNDIFEMEGYIEREISFEECVANDFSAEMCVYYYKFCITYADGASVCQYAEEDPYTDVDESERFWAPEDQDFLPPTKQITSGSGGSEGIKATTVNSNSINSNIEIDESIFDDIFNILPNEFILPHIIQWAEAREAGEPTCYTQACQKTLDAGGFEESEPTCYTQACQRTLDAGEFGLDSPDDIPFKDQTKEQILKSTSDLKIERDNLEQDIIEIEQELQWYNKEITDLTIDMDDASEILIEHETVVKETKSDYVSFIKVSPQTREELDERRVLVNAYETALRQYDIYEDDYDRALKLYNDRQTLHFQNIYEIGILENKLDLKIKELFDARIAANLAHRTYQFVNIILSGTCLQLIENESSTKCPTYRELHEAFDNTIPAVSGEFIDKGYDIFREPSKYQNHWKFYEQIPWFKVITVDPDVEMQNRGITIVVQSRNFEFVENMGLHDKSPSINSTLHERYVWSNIKVNRECNHAITSPDLEMIGKAVHHFLSKCDSELDNKRTISMLPHELGVDDELPQWTENLTTWTIEEKITPAEMIIAIEYVISQLTSKQDHM